MIALTEFWCLYEAPLSATSSDVIVFLFSFDVTAFVDKIFTGSELKTSERAPVGN